MELSFGADAVSLVGEKNGAVASALLEADDHDQSAGVLQEQKVSLEGFHGGAVVRTEEQTESEALEDYVLELMREMRTASLKEYLRAEWTMEPVAKRDP